MNAIPARVVETGSLWDRAPGLISLQDFMEEIISGLLTNLFSNLTRISDFAETEDANEPMTDRVKAILEQDVFAQAEFFCRKAGLKQSAGMVAKLREDFSRTITHAVACRALDQFSHLLTNEMADCHLFLAPKDRLIYHDNERLFGETVHDAFPSARMDIREAGNCWLFGRNNAVVYHLMCAAEVGLRALAADRGIELAQKGSPLPLELAQWGEILQALDDKTIPRIRKWPPTQAREEAFQFFSRAIREARNFNDGYRRHAMHARGTAYEDDETQALMGAVRRFMQTLATKISEAEITPEVWT